MLPTTCRFSLTKWGSFNICAQAEAGGPPCLLPTTAPPPVPPPASHSTTALLPMQVRARRRQPNPRRRRRHRPRRKNMTSQMRHCTLSLVGAGMPVMPLAPGSAAWVLACRQVCCALMLGFGACGLIKTSRWGALWLAQPQPPLQGPSLLPSCCGLVCLTPGAGWRWSQGTACAAGTRRSAAWQQQRQRSLPPLDHPCLTDPTCCPPARPPTPPPVLAQPPTAATWR